MATQGSLSHRASWLSRRGNILLQPLDRRLRVERLEDRRMLATFTVDSLFDENDGDTSSGNFSLREAVQQANVTPGNDIIQFSPQLFATPQTMPLGFNGEFPLGEIVVTEAVTISGPGSELLTIDAQRASRIFNITSSSGEIVISGLTLTGGQVSAAGSAGRGGAIRYATGGSLFVFDTVIRDNVTNGDNAGGGGIYSTATLTMVDSVVHGNSTIGEQAPGGGVFSAGTIFVIDSTISDNTTQSDFSDGGGLRANGNVVVTRSTVSGNRTEGLASGGGGLNSNGTLTVSNSTITGNTTNGGSSHGGGIIGATLSTINIRYSTITGNRVLGINSDGGGIYNFGGDVTIQNSIVGGNTSVGANDDLRRGPDGLDVRYSLIEQSNVVLNGFLGNISGSSPQLGALASNGGPAKTHAPVPGSPVIDTGEILPSNPPTSDQRGTPFDRVAGGRIDMGAYETQTVAGLNLSVDSILDHVDGNYGAGELSLREAIGLANGSVGANSLTFDAGVFGAPQTIILAHGELAVGESATIDAGAVSRVVIDAEQQSRVFHFAAETGDFSLINVVVANGKTEADGQAESGGGIRFNSTGTLSLVQSVVSGSATNGDFARGGGIYSRGGVSLDRSTVNSNLTNGTSALGGGIHAQGDVTLTNSTVFANSTFGPNAEGGGINANGDIVVEQSTVSGNRAFGLNADGGGLRNGFGAITLRHATVTNNQANGSGGTGGGIWSINGLIDVENSIVAGNTAVGGMKDVRHGGTAVTANYSLLGTTVATDVASSGNLVRNDNPMLGALALNGGDVQNHLPLAGSGAIDMGDPNFATPPDFDQRGAPFARVVNGRIDIGAVEDQPIPASADFDEDGDVDGRDFLAWQRGFGVANAMKTDGDADNDLDVDGDDLDVWQGQYGTSTFLATVESVLNASREQLVDAVLAIETLEREPATDRRAILNSANFDEALAEDRVLEWRPQNCRLGGPYAAPNANDYESRDAVELWLDEQLVEDVCNFRNLDITFVET